MSQSIFEVVDDKTVWIKAYIDEKLSGSIRVGQEAVITLRSQREIKYKGIVKRIVAKSDAVTQEREVDVAFEKLPIPFYIDEQAEVLITVKNLSNIVKIPVNAVVYKNGEPCIWINENNKAFCKSINIISKSEHEVGIKEFDINSKILIPSASKKSLMEGMSVH